MQNPYYFDFNATTPLAPDALEAMLPYFSEIFANPSGQSSEMSWQSQSAIKESKYKISNFLDCKENEIYFTSGATESINWLFYNFRRKHILVSEIDHDASYICAKNHKGGLFFESQANGQIDEINFLDKLNLMKPGSLVSFLLAHNEVGTLLDYKHFIKEIKKRKLFLHLDVTQALGKIDFSFCQSQADFISLSAHKVYGPKGIGCLVVNRSNISDLEPFILGGGQQGAMRSGTLNTPLIVGMAKAFEIAKKRQTEDIKHYKNLKKEFLSFLSGKVNFYLNGDPSRSLPNTLNITFKDWNAPRPFYLELLPFSTSAASACSSEKAGSRVLQTLKIPNLSTIRISFGRTNEIQEVLELAKKAISALEPFKN